jgi:hypothetical protein
MLGSATTPLPYASQCELMGRLSAAAVSQTGKRALALELLERVADGRTDQIGVESEVQVDVPMGTLRQTIFAEPTVRACALRKIGETGLPEAEEFLANLKQADIGTDSGQQIWPAAQVALRDARLRRVDPQSRISFLESVLMEPHDAVSNSAIGLWAVQELCDRGSLVSLSGIQKSIRNFWTGQRGEDEIRFCEARIQVIRRNPDRAKALGSALALDDGVDDTRLRLWAIYQLDAMHSSEADAELGRFANDIRNLPMQSPARQRLSVVEGSLQEIQNRRAARPK